MPDAVTKMRFLLFVGAMVAVAAGSGCPNAEKRGQLRFVSPQLDQAVGGSAALVWVIQDGTVAAPVVVEVSQNDEPFVPLTSRPGPDRGDLSHTLIFDPSTFAPGPLILRAGYPDGVLSKPHEVEIAREPVVECRAAETTRDQETSKVTVAIECEAGVEGAEIRAYEVHFGDGAEEQVSELSNITHAYLPGSYIVSVTATSAKGLSGVYRALLEVTGTYIAMAPPPICGCEKMEVSVAGQSQLGAPRPGQQGLQRVALGPDATYGVYYFEVVGMLTPGSNPFSCEEGQDVKRTNRNDLGKQHKGVCSKGLVERECSRDRDCNDKTCRGGSENGKKCNTPTSYRACVDNGGRCRTTVRGTCKTFPFNGTERTDDDYHARTGETPKKHRDNDVIWLDGPGEYGLGRFLNYVGDFDFLAYLRGGGGPSCSCHLRLHIEASPDSGGATRASRLRLIPDAETDKCSLVGTF